MKKNTLLYIAAITAIGLSSCSKQLDEVTPDTKIGYAQLNKNNLPLVINGAKLALTNNNSFYLYYAFQDIMSDDFESLTFPTYENNNIAANDASLPVAYRQPYQCIANVNMAIQYASQFPGDSAISSALGEAYLLRAFSYMLLTESFGDAVIIKGGEDPKSRPARNPLTEVNAFIESDLKSAIDQLPDYNSPVSGSKQAAQLLLARLYLNLGRNDEALTLAQSVISSGKFALQAAYADIFQSQVSSGEVVYKITEASTSASYGLPAVYGPGTYNGVNMSGNGNTWADSNLVKSYEPADVRRSTFIRTKGASLADTVYFLTKFPQELTPSYMVCRYSEALLIVSEANARKGIIDVNTYNQLRSARKASTVNNADFASPAAFLTTIEQERRREFIGERLRWSDMRRFGKIDNWLQSFGQPVTHVLMPLPSREFFINPNLAQNADYSK